MKTRMWFLALAGACATAGIAATAQASHDMAAMAQAVPAAAPVAAPKLQAALRSLWHGHIVHTREYAMAVHEHNDAKAKAAANAVVANAVAGFYGKPAGDQMLKLLAGHWAGVKALTDAGAANDANAQKQAIADLSANATAIAEFLSGANPNWPKDAVQSMLATHVAHHSTEVQQIMTGD